MEMDPYRLVAFLHVVLFAYWLGADLGVMITSIAGNTSGLSPEARARIRWAGDLIDMAPRTALVLVVPTGLTLASNWGLPLGGGALMLVWLLSFAWLAMVWAIHGLHGKGIGPLLWKVDLGVRVVATAAFIGLGLKSLATGAPIEMGWLATKLLLFGVLILLGVIIRILLLIEARRAPAPAAAASTGSAEFAPLPFWTGLRITVFVIWALVFVMAFLGVVKPM